MLLLSKSPRSKFPGINRLVAGLTTGCVALLAIVIFAIVQWQRSDQQSKIALARQLAAQAQSALLLERSPQEMAVLLAIQSMRLYPSGEAAQILQENTVDYPISRMNWSTSGETWDVFIHSICFSPDGKYIVSGGRDHTARVWDASTGEEISRITQDGFVASVAVSPDSKYVASGGEGRTIRVWDISTGQEITHMAHGSGGYVSFVAFSPNGKYVVSTASYDKTIRLWDAKTGQEISHMTHDGDTLAFVTFSPDSQYMVSSGGNDFTARVWDISTGGEIARMNHDAFVSSVAFSPDGKHVASAGDHTARVWEADTGKEITRITQNSYVYFVSFSPDGKYIASGGRDNTAIVWNPHTGQEIAHLPHNNFVSFIAFSPDSRLVLSTERTGAELQATTHVWVVNTGQEIFRMVHNGDKFSIAFSPDGKHIVSTNKEGNAILLRHYLPGDLITDACSRVTRNLTRAEWQQYIGSAIPYQATCPNLPLELILTPVTTVLPTAYSTATP